MGIAVLSLYLIELRRPQLDAWPAVISSIGAPVGIAAGALTGGVISDVLGFSGQWIYVVVNVLLAGCLVGLLRSPKTTPRQRGLLASLRPVLAAPTSMGWLCAALSTAMVAAWSVGSLYQSLGSAMVATYLDHNGSLFAGVVVGMVIGLTTVGGPSFARVSPTTATFCSLLTITVGMIGMVLGLHLHDEPVFLVFSAVSGVGFGGATTGILRTVMAEVPSDEIGRFLTIVYLAGFVGSAFPAAIAAILDSHVGIRVALVGHASFVVAFAIVSSALLARVQMESSTTARG
ncbi:MFS transporter [Aeromicrobium sp. UC242_57]|uniref:MFS transporter n=1 Tax=Aeromicrobium sp. UC242_57 TaxID=3374624 RepID=UPI00379FD06B